MLKILLTVIGAFAAIAPVLDTFPEGRFSCERPEDAVVDIRRSEGAFSVSFILPSKAELTLQHYRWGGGLLHGFQKDAESFIKIASEGMPDNETIEPVAATEFKDLPAWRTVTRWSVRDGLPGSPKVWVRQEHIAVQRDWGYIVIQYDAPEKHFAEWRPAFERFKDSIVLLPEPPGSPWMLIPLGLLLLAGLIFAVVRLRRRA